MKRTILQALLLCVLLAGPAAAKTVYVDDLHEVMVRTGAGTDFQIIAKVPTGQSLELLDERSGWSLVRIPDTGKRGWTVSRYLTEEEPAAAALPRIVAQNEEMTRKIEELTRQNEDLSRTSAEDQKSAAEMKQRYETLAAESASFLAVKKDLTAARAELAKAKEKEAEARRALGSLERNRNLSWFLAGAGAILAGFLLGWIVRPKKKRSSLY
ncbi:MAG: TIGR04211 family SH3 domain-containing protein [Thermodesulfobacteriota bacterium]